MSYGEIEQSVQDGQPVELYEFAHQNQYFRYASGDQSVVYLGNTYKPAEIDRENITSSVTSESGQLRIKAVRTLEVVGLFKDYPPSGVVGFKLYARHMTDPDAQFVVSFVGRVATCTMANNSAEFLCEPAFVSLKRNGLRYLYQRNCPHQLYGFGCNLIAANFKVVSTNFTLTGNTLFSQEAQGFLDNWFAGGYIEYINPATGLVEFRTIQRSLGTGQLYIYGKPIGLQETSEVWLYPGCDHTIATCRSKFNNKDNFGGCPTIPTVNPFGGTTVF